ncbi:EGF-like domain-containing protein [Tieghemostelium lacteum]|uniref:EGF-like domain-containing protein n=1 Tax=Tieghemostelium lacteum TaxID=361077 RepID=A0A152A9C7_TIELA|nr:EGF-like domain-containing protein [Tieghemostelium lacteum]|eukprot:KYR02828.1 EGF-like domain-containing protein [Tieghemostelium lacteum]
MYNHCGANKQWAATSSSKQGSFSELCEVDEGGIDVKGPPLWNILDISNSTCLNNILCQSTSNITIDDDDDDGDLLSKPSTTPKSQFYQVLSAHSNSNSCAELKTYCETEFKMKTIKSHAFLMGKLLVSVKCPGSCGDNGVCELGGQCKCSNGYIGELCDIKPCSDKTNPCLDKNSECSTTDFMCHCKTGYSNSTGTCQDIDECKSPTVNCSSNSICENLNGTYRCNCLKGFEKKQSGECIDINECLDDSKCPKNSICTNSVGSFECKCKSSRQFINSDNQCEYEPIIIQNITHIQKGILSIQIQSKESEQLKYDDIKVFIGKQEYTGNVLPESNGKLYRIIQIKIQLGNLLNGQNISVQIENATSNYWTLNGIPFIDTFQKCKTEGCNSKFQIKLGSVNISNSVIQLKINHKPCDLIESSNSQFTFAIPPGTGKKLLELTVDGQLSTDDLFYSYQPPTIQNYTEFQLNNSIVFTGENFGDSLKFIQVQIGNSQLKCADVSVNGTVIICQLPWIKTNIDVILVTVDGQQSNSIKYYHNNYLQHCTSDCNGNCQNGICYCNNENYIGENCNVPVYNILPFTVKTISNSSSIIISDSLKVSLLSLNELNSKGAIANSIPLSTLPLVNNTLSLPNNASLSIQLVSENNQIHYKMSLKNYKFQNPSNHLEFIINSQLNPLDQSTKPTPSSNIKLLQQQLNSCVKQQFNNHSINDKPVWYTISKNNHTLYTLLNSTGVDNISVKNSSVDASANVTLVVPYHNTTESDINLDNILFQMYSTPSALTEDCNPLVSITPTMVGHDIDSSHVESEESNTKKKNEDKPVIIAIIIIISILGIANVVSIGFYIHYKRNSRI